jgi:hypothetical protein
MWRTIAPRHRSPLLRAVDTVETDTLRVFPGQDFDGVAVEDGDDEPSKCSAVRM